MRLAHFSVQEYLASERISTGPAAHFALNQRLADIFISEFCVSYLLKQGRSQLTTSKPDTLELEKVDSGSGANFVEASILRYAVEYWYQHANTYTDHSKQLLQGILKILSFDAPAFCAQDWWTLASKFRTSLWYELREIEILGGSIGCAAYLGLPIEVEHMLRETVNHEELRKESLETALYAAAYGGHAHIIKKLFQYGAKPDARGQTFGNALQAAALGNLDVVELLLTEGADPNIEGGRYGSPLQAAAFRGSKDIVQLLLAKGADPGAGAETGSLGSALQTAAYRVDEDLVSILLSNGADPNTTGGKYGYPLQAAAYRSSRRIVKLLLDNGADPNIEEGEYGSALQASTHWADGDIITLLLDRGANPDISSGNRSYGTALQAAANWGTYDIAKLLLERGADPNAQAGKYGSALEAAVYRADRSIVELLLDSGAELDIDDEEYHEVLKAAASRSNTEVANLLLDPATNPTADIGCYGKAVQLAALRGYKEGTKLNNSGVSSSMTTSPRHHGTLKLHENLTQILPGVDDGRDIPYSKAFTPLHWAAWFGHAEVVHIIFETDPAFEPLPRTIDQAPISPPNVFEVENPLDNETHIDYTPVDWSPLHVAIFRQHTHVVKAIAQEGPLRQLGGHPELKFVAMEVLEGVVDLKRDLNGFATKILQDSLGWTVAHVAALLGQAKLLRYLTESVPGVDVNMADVNGMTPLHWVAAAARPSIVSLLISLGADTDVEDNWGRLPTDLATGESRIDIIKLLKEGDVGDYPLKSILSHGVNFACWRVCDSCDYVFRHTDLFLRK